MKSKTIISHINEISETIATTLAYDFDDNFSDVSDDTNYFKEEEGVNESIKEDSKNFKVIIKAGDNDDVYFYSKDKKEKGVNKEVSKVSVMIDDVYFKKSKEEMNKVNINDDNKSNYSTDFEEEVLKKSDDDSNSNKSIDLNHPIHDILLYEKWLS